MTRLIPEILNLPVIVTSGRTSPYASAPVRGPVEAEVARLTGVSLCSVKRIAQEGPVVHVDDAAERAQRQVGRPSTMANFRKPILEILQHTPDLASLEILRRVREAGYEGGKTALYALVASLRPKSAKPLVRFEGLPGEFRQHDFGEIEVEFVFLRSVTATNRVS